MRFNSLDYVAFLAVVVAVYWALPHRARRWLLLGASLVFYMYWSAGFVALILWSTTIDYFVARRLAVTEDPRTRRRLLATSLVTNFGALFVFKYLDFALASAGTALGLLGVAQRPPLVHLVLPLGISFYTFEAISYTTDVFRGRTPAERDYSRLLLFIVFFPKLIAGPIERAWHLLPQFERPARFRYEDAREGLARILWGLFKKVVVADRLALYVDAVHAHPGRHVGSTWMLAAAFFTLQVYCDFSGYSDIAIGSAQLLGLDLLRNFRRPLFADSPADFWRRWHITLSTWFRDYLYFPLGGNRRGDGRTRANLFTVFLVSGIWHGANWTFVAWGVMHGVALVAQHAAARWRPVAGALAAVRAAPALLRGGVRVLRVAVSFTFLSLTLIVFRAASLRDAMHAYGQIFGHFALRQMYVVHLSQMAYGLLGVAIVLAVELATEAGAWPHLFAPRLKPLRWLAYAGAACLLALIGVVDGGTFLYFQF